MSKFCAAKTSRILKQCQWDHRRTYVRFSTNAGENADQAHEADHQASENQRLRPTKICGLDKPEDHAAQPDGCQRRSHPIDRPDSALSLRLSGICQSEITITAAAIGTLMKNAQRQEACSISHPPSTGPAAVVMAVKPDQVPMACPRDFSSNDALIIERLPGTRNAAHLCLVAAARDN